MKIVTTRHRTLATQVFLLMAGAQVVAGAVGAATTYLNARAGATSEAGQTSLAIARTVAESGSVRAALAQGRTSPELQGQAEAVRTHTGTDFVVIMSPQGIRYTHPTSKLIGQRFLGHIDQAVQGRALVETFTGTLGPSVRAVVPVFASPPPETGPGASAAAGPDAEARPPVLGLVSVGITVDHVGERAVAGLPAALAPSGLTLLIASLGSYGLSIRLRRQTHGLRPEELDRLHGLTQALSAHAHESANRLHAVISLIELGRTDSALALATAELSQVQNLTNHVLDSVAEPAVAALLIGKVAAASERGTELVLDPDLLIPEGFATPADLLTIVGNLIDNAIDAAAAGPAHDGRRAVLFCAQPDALGGLALQVSDTGGGVRRRERRSILSRGWSTKADLADRPRGLGLPLAAAVAQRYGGRLWLDRTGTGESGYPGATFRVWLPSPTARCAGPAGQGTP